MRQAAASAAARHEAAPCAGLTRGRGVAGGWRIRVSRRRIGPCSENMEGGGKSQYRLKTIQRHRRRTGRRLSNTLAHLAAVLRKGRHLQQAGGRRCRHGIAVERQARKWQAVANAFLLERQQERQQQSPLAGERSRPPSKPAAPLHLAVVRRTEAGRRTQGAAHSPAAGGNRHTALRSVLNMCCICTVSCSHLPIGNGRRRHPGTSPPAAAALHTPAADDANRATRGPVSHARNGAPVLHLPLPMIHKTPHSVLQA